MSLEVSNLSFAYGSTQVLSDMSFRADKGTLTAVMGPNGTGKTTLFRCMLGILKGYSGTISIDGENIKNMPAKKLAHKMAYIPQIHGMPFSFSVKDIVLMGTAHRLTAFSAPGSREVRAAEQAMERVNINRLSARNFSKLSGGEQQLVLIARALAQGTEVIIMDEPTASLDYGNQSMVLSRVHELARSGYTILMSTHDPQHAMWYADQALAISGGRVLAAGRPEEVIDKKLLHSLYGVNAGFVQTEQGIMIIPERKGTDVQMD